MGIPLRAGRLLDEHDGPAAPRVALISESFARRAVPGRDPIGQRLRFGDQRATGTRSSASSATCGRRSLGLRPVERRVRHADPVALGRTSAMSLVVRARGDAATLAPAVRAAIWSVDKDQPVVRVATMDELVAASAAERRFALILFEAFGARGAGARRDRASTACCRAA